MSPKSYLSLFVMLVYSLSGVHLEEESKYCSQPYSKLCHGKGTHVGCQFPNPGPGTPCDNYIPVKFTNVLKETILDFINRRRQKIAAGKEKGKDGARIPKARVMMYVAWDPELAELAQRLADQCTFTHDDCRATPRFPYAGQNVGEVLWKHTNESDANSYRSAIKGILNAWYGERRRALPQQITGPFKMLSKSVSWGHFSQLAIWSLRAVGCGAVRHGQRNHMRLLLVCDFSHNNMIGQKTVTAGAQMPCPPKTARRINQQFPLLCAPVKTDQEEEYEDENQKEEQSVRHNDEDYNNNNSDRADDHETTQKLIDEDDGLYNSRSQGPKQSRKRLTESRRKKMEEEESQYPRSYKARQHDNLRFINENIERDDEGNNKEDSDYNLESKSDENGNRDEHFDRRDGDNHVVHKSLDDEDERKRGHELAEKRKKNALDSHRRKIKDEEDSPKKSGKPRYFVKLRPNSGDRDKHGREKARAVVDDDEDDQVQPIHHKEVSDRPRESHRRDRPERPGALALATENLPGKPIAMKQRPVFSKHMDKEDLDQLFHDTGFKRSKKSVNN